MKNSILFLTFILVFGLFSCEEEAIDMPDPWYGWVNCNYDYDELKYAWVEQFTGTSLTTFVVQDTLFQDWGESSYTMELQWQWAGQSGCLFLDEVERFRFLVPNEYLMQSRATWKRVTRNEEGQIIQEVQLPYQRWTNLVRQD
jgi:hypothetical protein